MDSSQSSRFTIANRKVILVFCLATIKEDMNDIKKMIKSYGITSVIFSETNKLIETLEMNDYWKDSYTKYSKKIGLTVSGRFLDEQEDVVLDFPYKDTVLKAGMTKEDVVKDDLKPDELFYIKSV